MKYYVVIGHKKGEFVKGYDYDYDYGYSGDKHDCDWIEIVERDDSYDQAHKFFDVLDIQFREGIQYPYDPSKDQEGWLIGRKRITRILDFGNFGYQFVRGGGGRDQSTKRIQFPEKIIISFDKRINDNRLSIPNRPATDAQRIDIELINPKDQIIHCYDKECDVDPVVFKLAKFDNYGDAYIDLQELTNYQDFTLHIEHFVHFMKNYPNSNIFLVCKDQREEEEIKSLLRGLIKKEHLTNYFEFCKANFKRKSPTHSRWDMPIESGMPNAHYDTFSETIDEFFNEDAFSERTFYNVPFRTAKITIKPNNPYPYGYQNSEKNNWHVYQNSKKFQEFLQHNPDISLEIAGDVTPEQVVNFINKNDITANIILINKPDNAAIKAAIAAKRQKEIEERISKHGYDAIESPVEKEQENNQFRLNLEKYQPEKLGIAHVQNQNADLHVGQNQNQNQNQNQSQQLRQSIKAPYEPVKLEINNKTSIPDVQFAIQEDLLKSLIGLKFEEGDNLPQTEANIDFLFKIMADIINSSPASKDCYCPLSYSVEELIPGAFYVPKDKIKDIAHPKADFNKEKNTLFFSPPYASIAIKKDIYAFKPYHRPTDTNVSVVSSVLAQAIERNDFLTGLMDGVEAPKQEELNLLLNKLYAKRGQAGIDLLTKSLGALKRKSPTTYTALTQHYLLTSKDFSEFVDDPRYLATFDAVAKLKDQKKISWWNRLVEIQCRSNPNFDLNHLFSQFTRFWEDIDKLQKFIPIPEQFPFDDFADAGITLGKMYRIMIKSRNRFEQIESFHGGNISHAYMLFDLFNSSMYCKEMDTYCSLLTTQLSAGNAFDKSTLKNTYFSTKKLAELARDENVSLAQLNSYLYAFAAVNGNTEQHNNSDLAFYRTLFSTIEKNIPEQYSVQQKKVLYSTIMLFAAYGNNSTKERIVQDINAFVTLNAITERCEDILNIYRKEAVSTFFSAQNNNGKMNNSDAMPSLHTIATLVQKGLSGTAIITQITDLIVKNKALSPALQKITRDAPQRFLQCFDNHSHYLVNQNKNDETGLIQSLFLITVALNEHYSGTCTVGEYNQFAQKMRFLNKTRLSYLNQVFLDINCAKSLENSRLFAGKNWSEGFYDKVSTARDLDDVFFALQDYGVRPATIEASEKGLLGQIKKLEQHLSSQKLESSDLYINKKKQYADTYQTLINSRLQHTPGSSAFYEWVQTVDSSFSFSVLKTSYEALVQIIDTTKQDSLLKIIPILQQCPLGNTAHPIAPAQLLSVTALLLQNIHPIESITEFLQKINASPNANEKLLYLHRIFEQIVQEPTCYETNSANKKLNKNTTNQIKSCMNLLNTIDTVDVSLFDKLFTSSQKSLLTIPQYLQFLEALASPTNNSVKTRFSDINTALVALLKKYPGHFSDVLDIALLDATLITKPSFNDANKLRLIAQICKNERLLNSRKAQKPASNYKEEFAKNLQILLDKPLDLRPFYNEDQLAHPSVDTLVQLLNSYKDNVGKALHHYEKDPSFKRPHKKNNIFGKNHVADKELAYQEGFFDMSKQNDALDKITEQYSGFERSIRKNILFTLSTYINELGYRLPAFQHTVAGKVIDVAVRKVSDKELQAAFKQVKNELADLRKGGQDNIWQDKKYQRAVCKLLAIIREVMYRNGEKNAYSTQVDAILLALLAGDYHYAMQINTGEGKALIATAIAIALQASTGKQIVITTSNLSLAGRDAAVYNRLIEWFGITHETISATTRDKNKLKAKIIHTTGNDFALCHGKDVGIDNTNRIYLNDEYDYTMSHLTPAINSQSKPNEEENWWVYEEILDYVTNMKQEEAMRKPEQQVQGLIERLRGKFEEKILAIEKELTLEQAKITQNAKGLSADGQMRAKETLEKDYHGRIAFYAKRLAKLNDTGTEDQFSALIDSAIIAQFVLKKGEGYEVIAQLENGKRLNKVVPTEGGKPITEGDVMYMYGIHQFLIQKEILEYNKNDGGEFIKPSELESTTYFNNYSTQAGSKSIGITGTVPHSKYKMYEALIGGGTSDVIPPHQKSKRVDAVKFDAFSTITADSDHVCQTEEQLIEKLAREITAHDGPALVYCSNKNACEIRKEALIAKLQQLEYTVQTVIPGVTEDFTDGEKLTDVGQQAQKTKTVTLTVGDGRGIDITPEGQHGLLTICSFVPETPEKILQIYGRSGRNGQPGKTNLFILESELTQYGITFNTLDEEFTFLDTLRHKEFDFAIKKIGFMQYEIQKQIRDERQKTTIIAYMDDLYNKLLLSAVAAKVKGRQANKIKVNEKEHQFLGRWEPFVMLNENELESIYKEFCRLTTQKLQAIQVYSVNIDLINKLKNKYHQQAEEAIENEKTAQKSLNEDSIRKKLKGHAEKQAGRFRMAVHKTVELADGIEVDITDRQTRDTYHQFAMNLGQYDKIISMMQKYIGSHIGVYGFINEDIVVPYERIYQILEQQKKIINQHKKEETGLFYEYLASKKCLEALDLVLEDINSGSEHNKETVEKYLQMMHRYNPMTREHRTVTNDGMAKFLQKILNYYSNRGDIDDIGDVRKAVNTKVEVIKENIESRKQSAIENCVETYQALQKNINIAGAQPLGELAARPMSANNSKYALLFSMLQMVTKKERNSEPVKKIVSEISQEVDPAVVEYNGQVKAYKKLIKEQRICFEYLKENHKTKDKIHKYHEMVCFDDIASKNMVAFYHDYNKLPDTLAALKRDIDIEQNALAQLTEKVRRKQHIDAVLNKITKALNLLKGRIAQINHPLTEAIAVANTLLADLETAQNTYSKNLKTALDTLDLTVIDFTNDSGINAVNQAYIQECERLINNAGTRRVLERDLHWGPFLNNLLKTIVNVIISIVTFGTVNNFFTLSQSETIRAIDEEQPGLNPQ